MIISSEKDSREKEIGEQRERKNNNSKTKRRKKGFHSAQLYKIVLANSMGGLLTNVSAIG